MDIVCGQTKKIERRKRRALEELMKDEARSKKTEGVKIGEERVNELT